jgi:hypothetical protein
MPNDALLRYPLLGQQITHICLLKWYIKFPLLEHTYTNVLALTVTVTYQDHTQTILRLIHPNI